MKKMFAVILFLFFYGVFVIATLPVNIALSWLNLPKNISLYKPTGTIWQAKIDQVIVQQNRQTKIQVNNVNTALSLSSLLLFTPTIDIKFGGKLSDGPEGHLTLSGSMIKPQIINANITITADEVANKLTLPIDVSALGTVSLALDSYVMGKPLCAIAKGKITWPKAALKAFEQSVELGTLNAKVSCEKGALALEIDPKNSLGLSFTAYLRNQGQMSGNGYLTPGNKFPQKLKELLPFLGKPDNNGRYRLGF